MKKITKVISMMSIVLLVGCDNMTPREQTILSGSAIGALGGAAIGAIAGGGNGAGVGALIGAGAGAIGGAMINDRNNCCDGENY